MKHQQATASILLTVLFALIAACAASAAPLHERSAQTSDEAEIQAALNYVPGERIEKLRAFINARPDSPLKTRAQELIVSARAAWGDEKLRAGDSAGGLEQFRLAVADAPENMTEKLYVEVLSKIPYNLFLLGHRAGAVEVARLIEAKVKENPKRLLLVANFYTGVEDAQEAARVSEMVVRLAPDMAAAHMALALARHISLQLEGAATEYARALELDPKLQAARRSLADLRRAQGRAEDALSLYRELIASDATDKIARTGIILSLLELGKRDEAAREMEAALKDEPRNLQLLTGAAYWYAAHGENARALELAQKAVELEPRYVWAQIALARALIADGRPLAAEQVLRFARRYGRFPTLDYELANALAAAGLYTEAATELARSFAIRGGQIETQLAGRSRAQDNSFIELLAPERRASIFQATAADTEANARQLRALLAFNTAMGEAGRRETVNEREAVAAAQDFTAGTDPMRAYRLLYVADRLLRAGVASQSVVEFAEGAATGLDAAVDVPAASIATLADDLYSIRLQANAAGSVPPVPEVERSVRMNILRGRVEEIAGWALYNQEKAAEAVARLRRATTMLPENSIWWRSALWRLGAALEASGEEQEALASYLRSYDKSAQDAGRRVIIERLYRKLNGSLDGLEAKLGTAASTTPPAASADAQSNARTNAGDNRPAEASTQKSDGQPPPSGRPAAGAGQEAAASSTPTAQPESQPVTERPAASPEQPASATEASNQNAARPEPTPTSSAASRRPRPEADAGKCALSIDVDTITIRNNGGTGTIIVNLSGTDKITPSTRDWPDISVFAQSLKEYGTFPFMVTSISKRPGRYTVNFSTPCGSKDVTVIVK